MRQTSANFSIITLAFFAIPLLVVSTPALCADLDGPVYRERDVVIERAPPRVVERERVIERHHYYEPAPVYTEPRAYYAPPLYAETYYDRLYRHRYAYAGFWRPRRFGHWHRHHRHRGW